MSPYPFGPGWEQVLAARAGNYVEREPQMNISLDRRAAGADPDREVKFAIIVKPLDVYHTHGELSRCDQQAVMAALAKAADEIVEVLRRVPPQRP